MSGGVEGGDDDWCWGLSINTNQFAEKGQQEKTLVRTITTYETKMIAVMAYNKYLSRFETLVATPKYVDINAPLTIHKEE